MFKTNTELCKNHHIYENDSNYIMKIPSSEHRRKFVDYYSIEDVKRNKSFRTWEMIRALSEFILKDEANVIDHMGYDFKLNIYKTEAYIPDCVEAYNKWLTDFIQLLKEEDTSNLTENKIEYNRLALTSLKRMNGYFTYNIEPKLCDCSEVECQCVVKMIFEKDAELTLERNHNQKAEFTLYVPEPDEYTSWYWVMLEAAREYGFSKIAVPILSHSKDQDIDIDDIEITITELKDWLICNRNYSMEVILCCPDEDILIETIKIIDKEENY